ncbi:MAG TPA: DUF542 domain-containing protein [Bacillota bacterium]
MTQADTLRGMTVNRVVERWPETMPTFQRFGIDMCCGGWMTVDQAAREVGADVDELCNALLGAANGEQAASGGRKDVQ